MEMYEEKLQVHPTSLQKILTCSFSGLHLVRNTPFSLWFNRSSRHASRLWQSAWRLKSGMGTCPGRLRTLSTSCSDRWEILLGALVTTVRRWRWAGGFNRPWKRWETPYHLLHHSCSRVLIACPSPSTSSGVMKPAPLLPGWEGSPLSAVAPTPSRFSTSSLRNLCGLQFPSRRSGSVRSQSWPSGSMVSQRPQQSSSVGSSQFTQMLKTAPVPGAEEGRRYIERTVSKHSEMVGSIRELSDRLMELEAQLKVSHARTYARTHIVVCSSHLSLTSDF